MKKIIAILILFIPVCVVGQEIFPTNNAIWNENFIDPNGYAVSELRYGLYGDTVINDTLYHKLYALTDTILTYESVKEYIGAIRSEDQKVWLKPELRPEAWTFPDILLYDFAAEVGDTVWHNGMTFIPNCDEHCYSPDQFFSIVTDVDIQDGHKTLSTKSNGALPSKWYEGIGSNLGLLGSIRSTTLMGESYNLACFKHNDTVKFVNNLECDKCFCTGNGSGLINKNYTGNEINIYPNPANGFLYIEFSKSNNRFEIVNASGQRVFSDETNEKNYRLEMSGFSGGVYFLKVKNQNNVWIKKVILNR